MRCLYEVVIWFCAVPDCNVCVQEITKKSSSNKKAKKSKKGGKTTAAEDDSAAVAAPAKRRYKACPSFFRFFSPVGAMSHGSSGKATAGSSIGHDPTALHPDDDESELHEEVRGCSIMSHHYYMLVSAEKHRTMELQQ